jgi:DNA-binding NarL/FixJ family response regulator
VEDHEILRYGLVACLAEDGRLEVTVATVESMAGQDVDVAVVASKFAHRQRFECPIIVYGDGADVAGGVAAGNEVAGALYRRSLTIAQLHATVQAAVAGLRVTGQHDDEHARPALAPRQLRIVELVAEGCSTREIAEQMSYSERTIKKLILELQTHLGARTRAQVVAQAIRRGII